MPYEKPEPDQWIMPITEGYKLACCDCGLVHDVDFMVYDNVNGKEIKRYRVLFRVRRNNRATGQIRRHDREKTERASDPEDK